MKSVAPPPLVIGTAGHIDHGKTSLVRALTGVDTDRLAEEKRRGISIDLGFAHTTLPSGRVASFVDVPGHERFVKNMLAGASGIHAVLLVIAADESVMPQTREHFEICRLLGVRAGVLALTKVDVASDEQIAVAKSEVRELCAGSFLADAPLVLVSSVSGIGLNELQQRLDAMTVDISPDGDGLISRLPVDRSFSLKGFGTVVSGTLSGGPLTTGSALVLHPGARTVRIRGLHVHGKAVDQAGTGRTAVNVSGIESRDIERGFTFVGSELVETSRSLGVSLTWLPGEGPTAGRRQVLLHAGTAEIAAHLKMLGDELGILSLARPLLAFPGDRFILRRPSPAGTIAGGVVIDSFPNVRMRRIRMLARLKSLQTATLTQRLTLLVAESPTGRTLLDLVRLTGRTLAHIQGAVKAHPELLLDAPSGFVITRKWLAERRKLLLQFLQQFHQENPSKAGAPLTAARLGLNATLAQIVFADVPGIRITGDTVALIEHRAAFTQQEVAALTRIEASFKQAGFAPPMLADVLEHTSLDTQKSRTLLENLVQSRRLVRISHDLLFHADVIAHIRELLLKQKGRRFSVPEFKEWTQISRKYAIPLLEYLDSQRITRREGNSRIVL